MDLLAAFFFSVFVLATLHQGESSLKTSTQSQSIFIPSALVGMGLLTVVYTALVYFGSVYQPVLVGVAPEQLLGTVAKEALGASSVWIVCLTIFLACLTTALVLAVLFAEFLAHEVAPGRLSEKAALIVTLGIAFAISTLEFQGIARFLGPILETVYPALITLTLINIAAKLTKCEVTTAQARWPVALTLATKCLFF